MGQDIETLRSLLRHPTTAELELLARYASLPGDGARERAFEAFAKTGLPGRRVEGWRWSDFKSAFPELSAPPARARRDPFAPFAAHKLTLHNGKLSGDDALPAGLRVLRKEGGQAFGGAESLPLGALTAALSARPGALLIEVSQSPDQPLHLAFSGEGEMTFGRIVFLLRAGTHLKVLESHLGGAAFNGALVEYALEDGATLERVVWQAGGPQEGVVATAQVTLGARARLAQAVLAFGAKRARIETEVTVQGEAASLAMDAAYLAGQGYHIDLTSRVRFGAMHGMARQLTKGAARSGGRGVYQGKFHVARIAQKTDAEMEHHALLLEDGAEVNAKPELEIYADDVACAHGNTSGALDANALFYLRQRGVGLAEAQAMLTQAHLAEAFDRVADEAVRTALLNEVSAWLAT